MNQKSNWSLYREGICYSIRLNEGETIIGRLRSSNIQMDSQFCSRQHCKIMIKGSHVTLKDYSTNGTYVNEQKINSDTISLKPLDRLGIGVFDLTSEELLSEDYHVYILKNINSMENVENPDPVINSIENRDPVINSNNIKSDILINRKKSKSKCMVVRLRKENYIENKNIINPYNKIVTRSYKIKHKTT